MNNQIRKIFIIVLLMFALLGVGVTNTQFITGTFGSPPPAIGGRPGEPRQVMLQVTTRR